MRVKRKAIPRKISVVTLRIRLSYWRKKLAGAEDFESPEGDDDADGMTEASKMVEAYEVVLKDLL